MLKLRYTRKSLMGFLLLAACVLAAQTAAAADQPGYADNPLDKDNEGQALTLHKRPAFFVGSRYGRSGGAANAGSSKARRLIVVPRNDRFFLGSRYGKRSGEYLSPYEQTSLGLDKASALNAEPHSSNSVSGVSGRSTTMTMMSCVYTGISNFYRCSNADELNNIMNHELMNSGVGEDAAEDKKKK